MGTKGPTTPNPAFATATSRRPKASTAWPHRALERPVLRDVTGDDQGATAERADRRGEFLEPGHPARRQDQIRALARELPRERRSDAGRGAGHQDDAVREAAHLPCAP